MNSFLDFVAIRLDEVSDRTLEYKSISSFLSTIEGYGEMALDDQLRLWAVLMIDRGLAETSRKRYVEKLSSLYKEYAAERGCADNPFEGLKALSTINAPVNAKIIRAEITKLEKIFADLMSDAVAKPELALFLYLLFNASSDMAQAISLTTDEYKPDFPQLEDIIKPSEFHHRRKYVFDLNQNRKRMPQLLRDVSNAIDFYLKSKGLNFPQAPMPDTIASLWIEKARRSGVGLAHIKQTLSELPAGYDYLRYLRTSALSNAEVSSIKQRVAEAFAPSGKRWYAIKLRRGISYDTFLSLVKSRMPGFCNDNLLFYPQKKISRRVEKKIVTDNVPIIPDIVFFNSNQRYVPKTDMLIKSERIGYVFKNSPAPGGDYSVIDSRSMSGFQHMIGVFTPDIKIELTAESPVGVGREVLITGGVMAGYEGTIFDIKDDSDTRQIFIRLSDKYSIRAEVKVEEFFVKSIG